MLKPFTSLILAGSLLLPVSAFANGHSHDMPGVIHATATASVDTVPDQVSISAGVQTDGKTAREAMALNSDLMRRVFTVLAENQIPEQDVSTSSINLSPRYDYESRVKGQPRLVGYQASNQITITTMDLNKTGPLIDAIIGAGVNRINGINFIVSEPETAQAQARTQAIQKAQAKAQMMASAAGVSLGRLLSMREGSSPGPIIQEQVMMSAARDMSAAPPLAPGQRDIGATVTLSYAIAD